MAGADKAGEDVIVAVYRFFRSQGYPPLGAAYMVGSLLQESKLNPTILQPDGAGYGIAQWNDPAHAKEVLAKLTKEGKATPDKIKELEAAMQATSKRELIKFSKKNGRQFDTLVAQLHFAVQQNPTVTTLFKNAKTAAEAEAAVKAFEHFGTAGARFGYAQMVYRNVVVINQKTKQAQEFPERAGAGLGAQVDASAIQQLNSVQQQVKGKVLQSSKPGGGNPGGDIAKALAGNFGNQMPGAPSGGCTPMPPPPPPFQGIPGTGTPDDSKKHPPKLSTEIEKHPKPIPELTVTLTPKPIPEVTVTPPWWDRWWKWMTFAGDEAMAAETTKKVKKKVTASSNSWVYYVDQHGWGVLMQDHSTVEKCPAWPDLLEVPPHVPGRAAPQAKISERNHQIILGVSENEGAPGTIINYDRTALTFGIMQVTLTADGTGQLVRLIQQFKAAEDKLSDDPNHKNQYDAQLKDHGFYLKTDTDGVEKLYYKDSDGTERTGRALKTWLEELENQFFAPQMKDWQAKADAAEKAERAKQDALLASALAKIQATKGRPANPKELAKLKKAADREVEKAAHPSKQLDPGIAAFLTPLQQAGRAKDLQREQLLYFQTDLANMLDGRDTMVHNRHLSAFATNIELISLLEDEHVNAPSNVAEDFTRALAKLQDEINRLNRDLQPGQPALPSASDPTHWGTHRADYENKLIGYYGPHRRMTDPANRAIKIHRYFQRHPYTPAAPTPPPPPVVTTE